MEKKVVPQLTEEEMIQIIDNFKASGLTRRQFCLDNNYPMSNFYYWQKKYHQKFPLTEEQLKSRPGRKPKGMIYNEDGTITIPPKPKAKTKKKKKTIKTKAPKTAAAVSDTPKKRGRPAGVKNQVQIEVPVVADAAVTAIAETTQKVKTPKKVVNEPQTSGPVIMIKYPNGTKLMVSADISLTRLKEMINL